MGYMTSELLQKDAGANGVEHDQAWDDFDGKG